MTNLGFTYNQSMKIPIEIICIAITLIGWLSNRSIYGEMARNKTDSDDADAKGDLRHEKLVDSLNSTILKFTSNDRDIYEKVAGIKVDLAHEKGLREGIEKGILKERGDNERSKAA